jgi:hypothetical protein
LVLNCHVGGNKARDCLTLTKSISAALQDLTNDIITLGEH